MKAERSAGVSGGNQTPLHVLLVAPVPPPDHGGIATWTRIVRSRLASSHGVQLTLYDSMQRRRPRTAMRPWQRLLFGSAKALRDLVGVGLLLLRAKPHLLHLTTSAGPSTPKDLLILLWARIFQVRTVIHYRLGSFPDLARRHRLAWRFMLVVMSKAHLVVLLDRRSVALVRKALPRTSVISLPNMVDVEEVDSVRRRVPKAARPAGTTARVVYAGAVVPPKGIRELVEACANQAGHAVTLDIIGPYESTYRDWLERLWCDRQALLGALSFHGSLSHDMTLERICMADIFALPSYVEGAPHVVLEAMALQKVVVATDVGAVPEMLDVGGPEECGICVQPHHVGALTDAIALLSGDRDLRERMSRRGRKRVEREYAAETGTAKLVSAWCTLMLKGDARVP